MSRKKNVSKNMLAIVALACLHVSNTGYGAVYTVPDISMPEGNGKTALTISGGGNNVLDVSGKGFGGIEKGNSVETGYYSAGDLSDILNSTYKSSYDAFKDASKNYGLATTAYNQASSAYEAARQAHANNPTPENEALMQAAETAMQNAGNAKGAAENEMRSKDAALSAIASDPNTKLVMKADDVKAIFDAPRTETVGHEAKRTSYTDAVSGKELYIQTKTGFFVNSEELGLNNAGISFLYDKPVKDQKQFIATKVVAVDGDNTVLDVESNSGTPVVIDTVTKTESGIFDLTNGGDINFNSSITYEMGTAGLDTGRVFNKEEHKSQTGNVKQGKVQWKGAIEAPFGNFTVNDAASANAYNDALIAYIQTDERTRLMNQGEVQKFYDKWSDAMYSFHAEKEYDYTYKFDDAALEQVAKDAMKAGDVGAKNVNENYFVGARDSNSVITIKEGVEINSGNSGGTIVRGDFNDSGTNGRNVLNVDGTLTGRNTEAVRAKNMDINVGAKGVITGDITLSDGAIDNKGNIGNIRLTRGNLKNENTINGFLNVKESIIENDKLIKGAVTGVDSVLTNNVDGSINGEVNFTGENSHIDNKGVINASVDLADKADILNSGDIILNADKALKLKDGASYVGESSGNIYIGYQSKEKWDDPNTPKVDASNTSGNKSGISVVDGSFENAGKIYVSGTQMDVVAVNISGKSSYKDYSGAEIILDAENTNGQAPRKNNNKAILVSNIEDYQNKPIEINTKITMKDRGGTGIEVRNYADVILKNDINIDSVGDGVSYGIFVDGSYAKNQEDKGAPKFTMSSGSININADKGIGMHIRNGGLATVKGDASIEFATDKKGQIGVLLSGNTNESSLDYQSSKQLLLKGQESVLFRVERGASFDVDKLMSISPNITLDSNNSDGSSLFVVTTGATLGNLGKSHLNIDHAEMSVNGEDSMGVRVEGGATANIGKDTKIKLSGKNNIVAKIDGNYYDLDGKVDNAYKGKSELKSALELSNDNFVGAQESVGYHALNGGKLTHEGKIDFSTNNNELIGVLLTDGGMLESQVNSEIKVNGIAVKIVGDKAQAVINNEGQGNKPVIHATDGQAAYYLAENANLKLSGTGLTQADNTAHAVYIAAGSDKTKLNLSGNTMNVTGSGSGLENFGGATNILLENATINVKDGMGIHTAVGFKPNGHNTTAQSGSINVAGNGTGVLFENMDGTMTNNEMTFSNARNLVVNVETDQGKGIVANTSGNITSGMSVNIISQTGGAALEIKGTSQKVVQDGLLHSAAQNHTIVDLSDTVAEFTNTGDIVFGSFEKEQTDAGTKYNFTKNDFDDKVAVQKDGKTTIKFTNSGNISGKVVLTAENGTQGNEVILNKNSTGNKFITGTGNDSFTVIGIQGKDNDGVLKQFTTIDGGAGENQITFKEANFTITDANTVKNVQKVNLQDRTKLTLDDVLPVDTELFNINADSNLHYNINDDRSFVKQVAGDGLFTVEGKKADAKADFNFGVNQTNFGGTLETINVKYNLSGLNQKSLTDATLRASANSEITVGLGEQNLKGVHMNGGQFDFGSVRPDQDFGAIGNGIADHNIKADKLTLDSGTVVLDVTNVTNPVRPESLDAGHDSLLKQDDNNRYLQLIQAGEVAKAENSGNIAFVDADGNPLANNLVDIKQNGEKVANAKYGFAAYIEAGQATDSYKNGLYATVGLTEIELLTKEANGGNALRLDAFGADDLEARTLSAKLTGSGDVVITGDKEVVLKNAMGNNYTGKTIVANDAALQSGQNGSFGATSDLVLGANSKVDLNGKTEKIGALSTSETSTTNINGGKLVIDGAQNIEQLESVSRGALQGSGTLQVKDANLHVKGANNGLSAAVENTGAGKIFVERGDSLGTGSISLMDTSKLIANLANDTRFTNTFAEGDATAELVKNGEGTLSFAENTAAYKATTSINGGKVVFEGGNVASEKINVNSGVLLTHENTNLAGSVDNNSITVALGETRINQTLTNSGKFYVGHNVNDTVASNATVYTQDYIGKAGSSLHFLGQLSDDNSIINKFVVENDSKGESLVYVKNSDGMGGYTENGIKIIEVKGESDANFTAGDRIIAGGYTYNLQRGDRKGNDLKNWFLVGERSTEPTVYHTNYLALLDVLDLRLQDRTGAKDFATNSPDNNGQENDSMWARNVYSKKSFVDNATENDVDANSNYFQIGYDLGNWQKEKTRFNYGVMAGYYNGSNTIEEEKGQKLSGKTDIYTAGVYGTWVEQKNAKEQTYLDTWIQYVHGKNKIQGSNIDESYNSNGLGISVEAGYSKEIAESNGRKQFIEPKAQLTWSNVSQDTFDWNVKNRNGAAVNTFKQDTDYQLISRLGFRFAMKEKEDLVNRKNQNLFAEINWIHYFNDYEFQVGKDKLDMAIKDKAELKLGIEQQFNKNFSIWANGFVQVAQSSYVNLGGQLGVKYTF